MADSVVESTREAPLAAFRFAVEIRLPGAPSPLCGASFSECDGPSVALETRVIREGGTPDSRVELTGARSFGLVTLRRGLTSDLGMWRWIEGAMNASPSRPHSEVRADAEIVMLGADGGNGPVRFHLGRCLPVRFKAPSLDAIKGAIAIEELQIAYESLSVLEPGQKPAPGPAPKLVKARLLELDPELRKEAPRGVRIDVQFNPGQLRVNHRRVAPESGGSSKGTVVTSRLSVDLQLDMVAGEAKGLDSSADVRVFTSQLAGLMVSGPSGRPAGVRFSWGPFTFDGVLESLEETLDLFSGDGRPLRATVRMELARDDFAF